MEFMRIWNNNTCNDWTIILRYATWLGLTTCTAICRRILPGMPTLPDCRDHSDCKETASSCRSRHWPNIQQNYAFIIWGRLCNKPHTKTQINKTHTNNKNKPRTVFSPILLRSSLFISENWISLGSRRSWVCCRVSPSMLLIVIVRSSLPSASKFCLLQQPHTIFLVCFPSTGTFLFWKIYSSCKQMHKMATKTQYICTYVGEYQHIFYQKEIYWQQ